MYSCDSILECYNLFSGIKLSMRSFCFIYLEGGSAGGCLQNHIEDFLYLLLK